MVESPRSSAHKHGIKTASPYLLLGINMALGLVVMYVAMFSMIDGVHDFKNNLNMLYMAVTMWAPMGAFMLATMPGMYPRKRLNAVLYAVFIFLTIASFSATRAQSLVDDREFIDSMIPHHSGAILMCREAELREAELVKLCAEIVDAQRREIEQMQRIKSRLDQGR